MIVHCISGPSFSNVYVAHHRGGHKLVSPAVTTKQYGEQWLRLGRRLKTLQGTPITYAYSVLTNSGRLLKDEEIVVLYTEDCDEPYKVQRMLLTRLPYVVRERSKRQLRRRTKLMLCLPGTTGETLKLFLYWPFEKALLPPGECVELRTPEDVA